MTEELLGAILILILFLVFYILPKLGEDQSYYHTGYYDKDPYLVRMKNGAWVFLCLCGVLVFKMIPVMIGIGLVVWALAKVFVTIMMKLEGAYV